MENNLDITINSLQHYMYCKRSWGLLIVEGLWSDNYKTVEGNIVHTLVDNPFFDEKRKNVKIVRSLPIYFDELGIHGVADYVEFSDNITVIEYKNGKPNISNEINYPDSIQLAAQMMCVDNMFDTKSNGYVFYNTIGRRVPIINTDKLFFDVKNAVYEMKQLMSQKKVPQKPLKQNCNNCSLNDLCMPRTTIKMLQRDRITKKWEEENAKTS
jgi:CRISPR-associated exonuclease Cas4